MTSIILYDLAGHDQDVRFSPFCWLAKYALKHKQQPFDTIALGFQPKSNYPDPDYGKLPVMKADDDLIRGSDKIVEWLDTNIRANPLVDGQAGAARVAQVNDFLGKTLYPALGPFLFYRVANALGEADRAYFVPDREARFGTKLEAMAEAPGQQDKANAAMVALANLVGDKPYLSGNVPALADYLVLAPFLWQRSITGETLYSMPDKTGAWLERMLDLFDGYGHKAKCAGC
ncbi:MAG: glutathione S-transferase N-terminal domain-containing protein [Pseudomonadota bacterium]